MEYFFFWNAFHLLRALLSFANLLLKGFTGQHFSTTPAWVRHSAPHAIAETLELSENLIFWGSNKLAIRNPELRWQKIRAEPGMTQETAQYRK